MIEEDETAVKEMLQTSLVSLLGELLLDSVWEVRESAIGALR